MNTVIPAPEKASLTGRRFLPVVDIHENDTEFVLQMEMPGVTPAGVEVHLEKNVLSVRGVAQRNVPEGYQPNGSGWGEKTYERSFHISADLDREHFSAQMQDGVLSVRMPKSQLALRQSIPVHG